MAGLAEGSRDRPAFAVKSPDSIQPRFDWKVRDYAARCRGGDLSLRIKRAKGWTSKLSGRDRRRSGYVARTRLDEGQAVRVNFRLKRRNAKNRKKNFWIRCLPDDLPSAAFERVRPGGPRLFTIGRARYAMVYGRNGVPVWWYRVENSAADVKILTDGTIAWNNNSAGFGGGEIKIRSLSGRLLREIAAEGVADIHDVQLLPNGNYLYAEVANFRNSVDLTRFGGPSDAITQASLLREATPGDFVTWDWDSMDHIGLRETPDRWWQALTKRSAFWYDISHWNAVEAEGRFVYLSFRHLDAVYKVDRVSGEVIWKLGGTETPKSLKILNDPNGEDLLGGPHDVRVQSNGSITVFDNRALLPDPTPRAVRYRINEVAGTARLIESVEDREVPPAPTGGSARRLPSKEWLVSWGDTGIIGAYDKAGRPIYRLHALSYRANPVPDGTVGVAELRRAMDRMHR